MFPQRAHFSYQLVIRLSVSFLFVLIGVTALGQSGRRGSKSPAVPAPSPEAQSEKKPQVSDLARVTLIVGTNRGDVFKGIPINIYDGVMLSCAKRLKESRSVQVDPVTNEMTRGDATNRAKAAKEGYVVWLNLRGENPMGSYTTNLDEIFIEFTVFEATTAKVKAQGNSYQGARKGGLVVGPTGRSNNAIVENRLRIAAEDAAERILKALHLSSAGDISSSIPVRTTCGSGWVI